MLELDGGFAGVGVAAAPPKPPNPPPCCPANAPNPLADEAAAAAPNGLPLAVWPNALGCPKVDGCPNALGCPKADG